jgi:hypothetical protein
MAEHDLAHSEADMLDDDIKPRPAWPKVVGIISIVLGSLGLICGVLGTGSLFFFPSMMSGQTFEGGTPPVFPYQPAPMGLLVLSVFGTLWAVVLIVAGAMCVGRKPAARPVHLVWALVTVVTSTLSMYMQVTMQNKASDWMRDNPDAQVTQMSGGGVGNLIGLAVGGFFAYAWPLFVLIWFLMVKRRNSDVAEGVEALTA